MGCPSPYIENQACRGLVSVTFEYHLVEPKHILSAKTGPSYYAALNHAAKAIEIEDIEARVSELKRATEASYQR